MTPSPDIPRKAFCGNCRTETNHFLLGEDKSPWESSDSTGSPISGAILYELLKCAGCEFVSLRQTDWFSEHYDDSGQPTPEVRYFPHASVRRLPQWLPQLECDESPAEFVPRLLRQIYSALDAGSYELAAMGIRSVLDMAIDGHDEGKGKFVDKLNRLVTSGHIAAKQVDELNTLFDFGSASIHRGFAPARQHVLEALDVVEPLIQSLYLHPNQTAKLAKATPPRKSSSKEA